MAPQDGGSPPASGHGPLPPSTGEHRPHTAARPINSPRAGLLLLLLLLLPYPPPYLQDGGQETMAIYSSLNPQAKDFTFTPRIVEQKHFTKLQVNISFYRLGSPAPHFSSLVWPSPVILTTCVPINPSLPPSPTTPSGRASGPPPSYLHPIPRQEPISSLFLELVSSTTAPSNWKQFSPCVHLPSHFAFPPVSATLYLGLYFGSCNPVF